MKDTAEEFLAHHVRPGAPPVLADGETVDGWRVAAFIGRGGSGEVYRVAAASGAAALKILARDTDAARIRFLREAALLARMDDSAFPRFIAQGEAHGRPYIVMELLEPRALPTGDRSVAEFLLAVCAGAAALHRMGCVHRDIKPGNILWRTSPSRPGAPPEPVLADLGLVKNFAFDAAAHGSPVSIVDGRMAGVGTPGYAAPEQFAGDAVSPATDIYALGMLANACFGGRPPGAWGRIVDCATGAIPVRRFPDVAAFARAVRHRHWRRNAAAALAGVLLSAAASVAVPVFRRSKSPAEDSPAARERAAWAALCTDATTNRITRTVAGIASAVTNATPFNPRLMSVLPLSYHCREETNRVAAVLIRLEGRTNVFANAIRLDPGKEYRIVGPGTLDAVLAGPANSDPGRRSRASARSMRKETDPATGIEYAIAGLAPGEIADWLPSNGVVVLENCTLRNRTGERWPENGLYYILEGRSRLELPNIEETLDLRKGDFIATPVPEGCEIVFGGGIFR